MQSPIKRIVQFNHDADLVKSGYSDFLESSFQIEEALEGLGDTMFFAPKIGLEPEASCKEIARAIIQDCIAEGEVVSDVDRLDKACDAVVFAIGSMTKLGLNAQQITQALNIVMDANQAKLKCPKDEHGKLTKPADFPNPEPRLQELLNSRS
jgi:predicted HAD superfamily Cof-like phosphohydrolase